MDKKCCVWELKQKQQDNSQTVRLPRGVTTIGRGLNNFLRINSTLASRNHCEIKLLDSGLIFIRDLKSLNGTFLGSEKILPGREISLSDGDTIGIGVETTDLDNGAMCVFNLDRKVLGEDELEFIRGDNCVVPLNSVLCDDANYSATAEKTDNDVQDCENAKKLTSESGTVGNLPLLKIPNDCRSLINGDRGDIMGYNNVIDRVPIPNKVVATERHNNIDSLLMTDPVEFALEKVDNNGVNNKFSRYPNRAVKVADQSEADGSLNSKHNLTSADINNKRNDQILPQSSLCVDEHVFENDSSSQTNASVPWSKEKLSDLETNFKSADEQCAIGKAVVSESNELNNSGDGLETNVKCVDNNGQSGIVKTVIGELGKLNNLDKLTTSSSNSLNTTTMHPHGFLTTFHSQGQTAKHSNRVTKNSVDNLPVGKTLTIEDRKVEDPLILSNSPNECLNAIQNKKTNDDCELEIIETDESGVVSNKQTNEKVFISSIHGQTFCSEANKNLLDIDSTVKSIFKRRLSQNTNAAENVDNASSSTNLTRTKNANSNLSGRRFNDDDEIVPIDFDKNEITNATRKIEPSISESFTIDDDIIIIDDDDLLPCSQMFDIKNEATENDSKDSDVPVVDITDEDDISDTDSTDEWFLRLSQSDPLNLNTYEDDYNLDENTCGERCDSEVMQSNISEDSFMNDEENDCNGGLTSQISVVEDMDVTSVNDDQSDGNIVSCSHPTEDKIKKADSCLEQTLVSGRLNNTCLNSTKSKSRHKKDRRESATVSSTTSNDVDDQHLLKKKIKLTHSKKVSSLVKDKAGDIINTNSIHASKNDKFHREILKNSDDFNMKVSYNRNDVNEYFPKPVGTSLGKYRNLTNKETLKHDEFVNKPFSGRKRKSDVLHNAGDINLWKPTLDFKKPDLKTLIEEMVISSNKWDESNSYVKTSIVPTHRNITSNTGKQLKEKDTLQVQEHCEYIVGTKLPNDFIAKSKVTFSGQQTSEEAELMSQTIDGCNSFMVTNQRVCNKQLKERDTIKGQEHFEDIVRTTLPTVSNDLNVAKSKETCTRQQTLEEAKLMSKTINNFNSFKITNQGDCSLKLNLAEETKLETVQKKISEKYKKSLPVVVGAKALTVKKKHLVSADSRLKQNTDITQDGIKVPKSKPWMSKDLQGQSKVITPSADKKAYRKSKLSEIASKTNIKQSSVVTKPKLDKSLKKSVKNTHKNRTQLFLDNLVSPDNSPKEQRPADEGKQKSSLSQYKIPRKNVPKDNKMEIEAVNNEAGNKQVPDEMTNVTQEVHRTVVNNANEKNMPAGRKTDATLKRIIENQNEQPHLALAECDKDCKGQHESSLTNTLKPIIRLPDITANNEARKKVRFHHSDENSLIVNTRHFEIAEGSSLRPITKHIAKKDTPPQKNGSSFFHQLPQFNYFEETVHHICKWNTVWFQEKNSCKGEPPVFNGQIYHMKDSFISYSDYRRSLFPLMLYELWAALAKQHDQIQNRNKPFTIEIQRVIPKPVTKSFFPILKDGEKRSLCILECQILLEKSNHSWSPRMCDLVVLELVMKTPTGESCKRRILGYIFLSNVKPISSHTVVSPKLKARNAKASLVMDLSMYIREEKYKVDPTQDSRIAFLKNIQSDLRPFNALDCLSTSSMLNIICQPSINNLEVPLLLEEKSKSTHQTIDHLNLSQRKAVTNVSSACLTNTDMIHFIHGPPGCGKSEVIIGIIQMIFLAQIQNKLTEPPQILLCAPSNAAIDEIFLRLMEYRNKFQKYFKNRKIKMVRIGRADLMHKNVRSMSLDCLVEKDLKKSRDILDDEQSRVIELKTQEAKLNQLNYQLENLGTKKNDAAYIRYLEVKLAETIKHMKELEKGKNQKTANGREMKEKKKERELAFLGGANVIVSTLSSCFNPQMEAAHKSKRLRLTCCIVDEATQCTEPELLIPLMLGVRQLVLVGDPLQLPATVLSATAKEHGFGRSLFARHRDWSLRENPDMLPKSRYYFLDTQYRMHPEIVNWPSQHFYNSSIKSHDSLEVRSSSHPLLPYVILSHSFSQSSQEECNYEEVTLIEHLVQAINSSRLCKDRTIGIITPYSRQRELLRRKINPDIEVGTVDSFQGRECDIIIFSCVRTEGVGFMSGIERLNVALTRARYSLIICGNFKSLQGDSTWASLLQDAIVRGVLKTVATSYRPEDLFHAIERTK